MRKVLPVLFLLGACGLARAGWDALMPAEPGQFEFRPSYGYISQNAFYDTLGKRADSVNGLQINSAYHEFHISLRYGLFLPGLTLEGDEGYALYNSNFDTVQVTERPAFSLQYLYEDLGVGGYLMMIYPLGSADRDKNLPYWSYESGLIYGKRFGNLGVVAAASYRVSLGVTEDKSRFQPGTQFHLLARPRYFFSDAWSAFLGLEFLSIGNSEIDGFSNGDKSNVTTATPGFRFTMPRGGGFELAVPVSLMGNYTYAFVGVQATAFLTFRPD